MKRTFSIMLVFIMTLTAISPSVFAVKTADIPNENLVITTTETVSMKDENGQWVVLESRTSQVSEEELAAMQSLPGANDIIPLTVNYTQYRKNASFENGAVELSLNAKFEHEAGNYVECVSTTGSITKNSHGWIIISKDFSTSKNLLGTRAYATMDVVLKTTADQYREYSVTITCTRDGAVS